MNILKVNPGDKKLLMAQLEPPPELAQGYDPYAQSIEASQEYQTAQDPQNTYETSMNGAVDPNTGVVDTTNSVPSAAVTNQSQAQMDQKEYEALAQKAIEEQRQGLNSNLDRFKKIDSMHPQDINLAPLMALSDAWTGSNFAQSYKPPKSEEDRQKELLQLQGEIQKQRQGITTEQLALLKDRMQPQKFEQQLLKQQERQDRSAHELLLRDINKDPAILSQIGVYKGVTNAGVDFANADTPTVGQFNELDQAVRNALQTKGTGGVTERERDYLTTFANQLASSKQYWTGDPQDASKASPEAVKHLQNVAKLILQQIGNQAQVRYSSLVAGHEDMYGRHPEWQKDIDTKVKAAMSQFSGPEIKSKGTPVKKETPKASATSNNQNPASMFK